VLYRRRPPWFRLITFVKSCLHWRPYCGAVHLQGHRVHCTSARTRCETRGPITIVQVDAHLDWREERNGLRHTFSSPMRRASEMPWVERIIQVGMRGIGSSRKNDLDDALRWGVRIIPAASVHRSFGFL
jgi:arginase family enzyme